MAMHLTLDDFHPEFLQALEAHGYHALRIRGAGGLCVIKQFNLTWGAVVGMDPRWPSTAGTALSTAMMRSRPWLHGMALTTYPAMDKAQRRYRRPVQPRPVRIGAVRSRPRA